jgi:hypothetical protein
MQSSTQAWFAPFTWEFVTQQNAVLCQAKNALHKPTSDGHESARTLWEANHVCAMTLSEAIDLCRRCHRLAPFCFYNGNTFAAIARAVIARLGLDAQQAFIIRSLAGHIVAGVATDEEVTAFQEFSDSYSA